MGIDRGEILSSLLWVIYLDPLLTVLNSENIAPYCIDANNSIPVSSISTLGYMDDTNLLSSSTQGLTHMLSIAQEFYSLNNTKINFDKTILICNQNLNNNRLPLPDIPTPSVVMGQGRNRDMGRDNIVQNMFPIFYVRDIFGTIIIYKSHDFIQIL